MDTQRVVANAATLLEVRGDVETIVQATAYIEAHGLTPFDALHLVESDGDTIVSSDSAYDGLAPLLDLKEGGWPRRDRSWLLEEHRLHPGVVLDGLLALLVAKPALAEP